MTPLKKMSLRLHTLVWGKIAMDVALHTNDFTFIIEMPTFSTWSEVNKNHYVTIDNWE